MRKTIFILTLLFSAFTVNNAVAQFEGKITYNLYETDDNGDREDEDSFITYITPQRILLEGDESFKVGSAFKSDGLLIRLDKKDFVFFMDENTAMSISKAGITSFINMFGGADSASDEVNDMEKDFTFTNTGEKETIDGYTATKFVFESEEENDKGVVWMTQDVSINWGMLAEPWGDSIAFLTSKDMPTNLVLQEGWLPVKGTFYDDGEISGGFTVHIEPVKIKKEMVNLASSVTVTSLSEYLFQQMRQQ